MCYAHSRVNGICCVLITDSTYPPRVAFSVVMQALLEYEKSVPSSRWKTDDLTDDCLHLKAMDTLLTKYQNPTEADDLLKVKSDLEETTTLMNQCLDNVLKKGEKMDDLVGKSDDLSFHSKAFYNGAKDQNSCCSFQ
ncbi:Synaptobrevin [compost metagenome]